MGFYDEQVLPRFINLVCSTKTVRELRQRACAGLHGRVVEIGFGSGLNIPFYPAEMTSVAAIEPADTGWKLVPDDWTEHERARTAAIRAEKYANAEWNAKR